MVHGVTADEILGACDEKLEVGDKLTNPTISIAQAIRRHNLPTFLNLAQQQIKKAQNALDQKTIRTTHPSLVQRPHASPLMVQGLRTNAKDPDSHVVYFDTEALIGRTGVDSYDCRCTEYSIDILYLVKVWTSTLFGGTEIAKLNLL